MDDWKDIQQRIIEAEESLGNDSWTKMRAKLKADRRKRLWIFILSFILIISAGLLWWPLPTMRGNTNGSIDTKELPVAQGEQKEMSELGGTEQTMVEMPGTAQKLASEELNDVPTIETASINNVEPMISNTEESRINIPEIPDSREAEQGLYLNSLALEDLLPISNHYWSLEPNLDDVESPIELPNLPDNPRFELPLSRFELRLFAGTTYNIPNFQYHADPLKTHKEFNDAVSDGTSPGIGFDVGAELRFRLLKNLKIGGGIGYRDIVVENQYEYEINEVPVINVPTGEIVGYLTLPESEKVSIKSSSSYQYLNIPISFYYEKPLAPRWMLTGEMIHYLGILVNNSSTGIDPQRLQPSEQSEDSFNKTIASYQLRLGLQYHINPNLSIALEPSYRSYYRDVFNRDEVSWKPRDISLNLSAIIRLNNIKKQQK